MDNSNAEGAVGKIAGILLAHGLKLGGPQTPSDVLQKIGLVVKDHMESLYAEIPFALPDKARAEVADRERGEAV